MLTKFSKLSYEKKMLVSLLQTLCSFPDTCFPKNALFLTNSHLKNTKLGSRKRPILIAYKQNSKWKDLGTTVSWRNVFEVLTSSCKLGPRVVDPCRSNARRRMIRILQIEVLRLVWKLRLQRNNSYFNQKGKL